MEFGEWLHNQRQDKNLDVRTLAAKSHIDPSTISRIENLHTQSTLYTAYRICNGLNITSTELYYNLTNVKMAVHKQTLDYNAHVTSLSDVETLLDAFSLNQRDIYHYFAGALNQISLLINENMMEHSDVLPQFTPELVDALLSQVYRSTFRFDLSYPRTIDSSIILYNYEQSGILLLDDVGAYVRNLRRSKKETLKSIGSYTEISPSVLSRLEDGALERIKLSDILTLDNTLNESGLLLDMCWDVCKFDEAVGNKLDNIYTSNRHFTTEEFKAFITSARYIILLYVKICRWFQHLQGPDFTWQKYGSLID